MVSSSLCECRQLLRNFPIGSIIETADFTPWGSLDAILSGRSFGVLSSSLCSLHGQATFGSITGTVTDSTGAVIPNAEVQVTNQGTNVSRAVSSGDSGTFEVPNLNAGTYKVTSRPPALRPSVEGIDVAALRTVRVDVRMEVGEVVQVTVQGAADPVETDSASVPLSAPHGLKRSSTEHPFHGVRYRRLRLVPLRLSSPPAVRAADRGSRSAVRAAARTTSMSMALVRTRRLSATPSVRPSRASSPSRRCASKS